MRWSAGLCAVWLAACHRDGDTGDTSDTGDQNSPPSAEGVAILPDPLRPDAPATFDVLGWFDPDGDPFTLVAEWAVDDVVVDGVTGASLEPTAFAPGDVVAVSVMLSDGTVSIGPFTDSAIVGEKIECGDGWLAIPLATCADLARLDEDLGEDFCLVADIDCGSTTRPAPTGTFTGTLDGRGHAIQHLTLTTALFAEMNGTVRHLEFDGVATQIGFVAAATTGGHFEDIVVLDTSGQKFPPTGFPPVGGIVGRATNATLERCDVRVRPGPYTVDPYTEAYGGLVGYAIDTSIADCTVSWSGNATFIAGYGGGLVGRLEGGSIDRSSFDGGLFVGYLQGGVGGIAGNATSATLRDVHSSGWLVSDSYPVGGIAGFADACVIERASSTARIDGFKLAGLVGNANETAIVDSWARADLECYPEAGGRAGALVQEQAGGSITSSWSASTYASSCEAVGGLVETSSGTPSVAASYWDTTVSGIFTSAGGTGLTTAQMTAEASYVGWDFESTWTITEGQSYPCHVGATPCPTP